MTPPRDTPITSIRERPRPPSSRGTLSRFQPPAGRVRRAIFPGMPGEERTLAPRRSRRPRRSGRRPRPRWHPAGSWPSVSTTPRVSHRLNGSRGASPSRPVLTYGVWASRHRQREEAGTRRGSRGRHRPSWRSTGSRLNTRRPVRGFRRPAPRDKDKDSAAAMTIALSRSVVAIRSRHG